MLILKQPLASLATGGKSTAGRGTIDPDFIYGGSLRPAAEDRHSTSIPLLNQSTKSVASNSSAGMSSSLLTRGRHMPHQHNKQHRLINLDKNSSQRSTLLLPT